MHQEDSSGTDRAMRQFWLALCKQGVLDVPFLNTIWGHIFVHLEQIVQLIYQTNGPRLDLSDLRGMGSGGIFPTAGRLV